MNKFMIGLRIICIIEISMFVLMVYILKLIM